MALTVSSDAFEEGEAIPARYTCDGENISPPLAWDGVPKDAKSLALIVDDPDAPSGTFVHWVVFNLPATMRALNENIGERETIAQRATQGVNGFKQYGYGGPCPPSGTHRYFFKLYALDTELDLGPEATKDQLLDRMEGHVLAEGQLMGTYTRR